MIGEVSGAVVGLLVAVVGLSLTILGGLAKISSQVGRVLSTQDDHEQRLRRIEGHEDAHDTWHFRRGDR